MAQLKNFFSQNSTYNAEDVRQILQAAFPREGVLGLDDMVVSTPGNTSVQVTAGRCIMSSTRSTNAARMLVQSASTTGARRDSDNSTAWAPQGTGYRYDIVYVKAHDQYLDGGATDIVELWYKQGTPNSGLPSMAGIADAYYVLAEIYSINGGSVTITDRRELAQAIGGVAKTTSTSRPASGTVWPGYPIYETDLNALKLFTGRGNVGWQPPWNMPWGVLGQNTYTSVNAFNTLADVVTLGSITLVANRRYKLTYSGHHYMSATDTSGSIKLMAGATNIASMQCGTQNPAGEAMISASVVSFTGSGATTIKATAERAGGTGNFMIYAAATYPVSLILEDIGPAGSPA